ncbi:DUF6932 family protein [Nanoarchaeota archaeon]
MAKQEKKAKEEEMPDELKDLPPEVQKKLKAIKEKVEKFKKKVLTKFEKYVLGIALLPPEKPKEGEKPSENINTLILVDDSDSKEMGKEELADKLHKIIEEMAKEVDKNIKVETVILSELWQDCSDGKYDLLQMIAISAPVYDKGMLAAIKISEVHKQMVLKKFEKYIVSYVLAGSFVQGKPNPHDIDVYIVIDDTDVKRMTRTELKDKLRAIIIGMAIEAGQITGIEGKLHVQVYILTDFWDSLKEANPVILTFLRDGVPFYDRGVFTAWKQLLKMGKIKPSPEAIEMYMSSGEQVIERVRFKLNDIGMEDIFYAILTPSQAALMLYGVSPPTPRETASQMRELFVKKEKILEEEYVKIFEKVFKLRKEMEYEKKKQFTGKEIDDLLKDAQKYLGRLKKLYEQIDTMKENENMLNIYESSITVIRDVLRSEDVERTKDVEAIAMFKTELVNTGKIPERYLRILNNIVKGKKDYDLNKLTRPEIEKVRKDSREFFKFLIEYIQRKRGQELERTKIRIKHGDKYGEVTLLGEEAFIIYDIDAQEKEVTKAKIKPNGSLGSVTRSSLEEFEEALSKVEIPKKAFIKEAIFGDLTKIFGENMEVLINY